MEARTHCPACGVKLPERSREMSNCLYCNFPFEFSEANGEARESPYKARIQKVADHPDFQAAVQWEPEPGQAWHEGRRRRNRGIVALVLGGAAIVGGLLAASTIVWLVVGGVALAAFGIWQLVEGLRRQRAEMRWPLMRRACAITDRRSVTDPTGLAGRTTYHFTIEFEDGIRGEFAWPGRGTAIEPLSTGITGVAYTRGPQLVSFKQIRT